MTPPTPYYQDDHVTLYHGDCLEVLRSIDFAVDAVVTDPPYASGTRKESAKPSSGSMLRGEHLADARLSDPIDLDQMTTTGFIWLMRSVGLQAWEMLPDGGSFVSFIDWRQWPQLVGALETCNYRIQNMLVWDKGSFGMGNGFRNQHELVCHAAKGTPNVYNRSTPNVLAGSRVGPELIGHPSPKPVGLMAAIVAVVAPVGGVVLDPFMGSGATLEACRTSDRRFVGIEKTERYCEIAAKRLEQQALDFGGAA